MQSSSPGLDSEDHLESPHIKFIFFFGKVELSLVYTYICLMFLFCFAHVNFSNFKNYFFKVWTTRRQFLCFCFVFFTFGLNVLYATIKPNLSQLSKLCCCSVYLVVSMTVYADTLTFLFFSCKVMQKWKGRFWKLWRCALSALGANQGEFLFCAVVAEACSSLLLWHRGSTLNRVGANKHA